MDEKIVSVNAILLDVVNPRFDPVASQREAISGLLDNCGDKILKLASDIISNGTNPTDILICVKEVLPNGKTVFIAKEGNRRVLAVKALLNPRIIDNAKWKSRFLRLIHTSGGVGATPKRLKVIVFAKEESDAMKHWIVIKHDGENGGAGTVPWGSSEKTRFSGNGRNSFATAVMSWLKGVTGLSQDDQKKINDVPITTLDRILASAQGRVILGVLFQDGKLHATRKVENVTSNLLSVVRDLTTPDPANPRRKKINVSDVKNTELIQNYLRRYERDDDCLDTPVLLTQDGGATLPTGDAQPVENERGSGGNRRTVAPTAASTVYLRTKLRELGQAVSNGKLKKLIGEMLQMQLDKVPLSFCIVFRSLLDISMHGFAHRNGIPTENVKYKDLAAKCKDKLMQVSVWSNGQPRSWINEAIHVLTAETMFSISELNNLVHGNMQVPSCDTILNYAPRIIPFLIALNGGNPPAET